MTTEIKVEHIATCFCDYDGHIVDDLYKKTRIYCDHCNKQYVAIEVSEYGRRLQLGRRVYKGTRSGAKEK